MPVHMRSGKHKSMRTFPHAYRNSGAQVRMHSGAHAPMGACTTAPRRACATVHMCGLRHRTTGRAALATPEGEQTVENEAILLCGELAEEGVSTDGTGQARVNVSCSRRG